MSTKLGPAPVPTPETTVFWDAARQGRLLIRRCKDCERFHWYPRALCPFCFGETEWVDASGNGTIYSYSITRGGDQPYVLAYVTLEEGPTMMTNVIECPLDKLDVGMAVKVRFAPTQDGPPIPVFGPV